MRKIWELAKLNFGRDFFINLFSAFLFPFLMLVLPGIIGQGEVTTESFSYAVVNEDEGQEAADLLEAYPARYQFTILDRDEAQAQLLDEEIQVYFVIPSDFSSQLANKRLPQIQVKTVDVDAWNGVAPDFVIYMQEAIREKVLSEMLADVGVQNIDLNTDWHTEQVTKDAEYEEAKHLTLMAGFSIFYGASIYIASLVQRKKERVFYRGVSSPTSPAKLLAASLLPIGLAQFVGITLVLLLYRFLVNTAFSWLLLGRMVLISLALCLFALSLQILALRIFKESGLAVSCGMFLSLAFFALGFLETLKPVLGDVPEAVFALVYLSPFHWAIAAIDGHLLLQLLPLFLGAALIFSLSVKSPEKFLYE
jgi:hypothetical protein